MHKLKNLLKTIDGKGYKEYKKLKGTYDFGEFVLSIDHVQSDPFAPPSRIRLSVRKNISAYPPEFISSTTQAIATSDYILRKAHKFLKKLSSNIGTGKSGILGILEPSCIVENQTAVVFRDNNLEIRFFAGLPAYGRRIAAKDAYGLFFEKIFKFARHTLFFDKKEHVMLNNHVFLKEDQEFLRKKLVELGIVAFVADESILPRETGISQRPLKNAVKFRSPDSLRINIQLPHRGMVSGMGIKKGVTLVTGGGYHGKSTLLRAIIDGIYDHVEGDGREFVITIRDAHYIRSEDRRRIEKVNIKPFIDNLPSGIDTMRFSTDNASGSTSQAANIQEAVEIGAKLLLLDEDTSATNFMTRDRRMQELIDKSREPITPFLDRIRELYNKHGVSTILIAGGIGDFLEVADNVVQMDTFLPMDITEKAKKIIMLYPSKRKDEITGLPYTYTERIPIKCSINPQKGRKDFSIKAQRKGILLFGKNEIDLTSIEEILTKSQTLTIGYMMLHLIREGVINDINTMSHIKKYLQSIDIDQITPFSYPLGELYYTRAEEVIKALNRLRTLKVKS